MQDISLLLVYGMGKRFVNATGEVEKIRLATESKRVVAEMMEIRYVKDKSSYLNWEKQKKKEIRRESKTKKDFSFDVSNLVCIKIEIFFLLYMSHILFKSDFLLPGCAVEFHVFSKKTLDDGNGFPSQECTEDSADSDAVESVEDCKGKNHSSCQTGEIEGCLNDFIVLFYNPGQIAREDIRRDDWKHTVVGKADTEAHQ